jgi:type II secretory pathway predicted ATPase ExeA
MSLAEPLTAAKIFHESGARPHVSASLDRLLAVLVDHLRERRGIVIVNGESGSGKTTALRQLAVDAAPGIAAVLVQATTRTSARDLYSALLLPLQRTLAAEGDGLSLVRAALAGAEIPYPALLVDDAELLPAPTLGALAALAAPGAESAGLAVVLTTSTASSAMLKDRAMVAASSGTFAMPRLSRREVDHFVHAHLRRAQLPLDAFPAPALEEISRRSDGNPRAVARIAGNALERALRSGRTSVILDDLCADGGPAERGPAVPASAAIPNEAEIEKALRAIRGSVADNPSPQGRATSPVSPQVVIPATAGDRPTSPRAVILGSGSALAVPAPSMPRSIRVAVAGVVLASAAAIGLLALTYSGTMRGTFDRAFDVQETAHRLAADVRDSSASSGETIGVADTPYRAPSLQSEPDQAPTRALAGEAPVPQSPEPAPIDVSSETARAGASEELLSIATPTEETSNLATPPIATGDETEFSDRVAAATAVEQMDGAAPAAPQIDAEAKVDALAGQTVPLATLEPDAGVGASATTSAVDPIVGDDLTRLFTDAEAAIRRQMGQSARLDGIRPELQRTFEAFLRSLDQRPAQR